jgi:hypothetical protein
MGGAWVMRQGRTVRGEVDRQWWQRRSSGNSFFLRVIVGAEISLPPNYPRTDDIASEHMYLWALASPLNKLNSDKRRRIRKHSYSQYEI